MRVVLVSRSPAETRRAAETLGRAVDPVPRAGLTVLLLGDLGAGKTVFAGGFFRGLGLPGAVPVVSPTFTVARSYRGRVPIHHVDAYHLRSRADLEAAGFEEMRGEGQVTCVEWGDRIPDAFPTDRLEVTLTPIAPEAGARGGPVGEPAEEPARRIEIEATGPTATRILARFEEAWSAGARGTP